MNVNIFFSETSFFRRVQDRRTLEQVIMQIKRNNLKLKYLLGSIKNTFLFPLSTEEFKKLIIKPKS